MSLVETKEIPIWMWWLDFNIAFLMVWFLNYEAVVSVVPLNFTLYQVLTNLWRQKSLYHERNISFLFILFCLDVGFLYCSKCDFDCLIVATHISYVVCILPTGNMILSNIGHAEKRIYHSTLNVNNSLPSVLHQEHNWWYHGLAP